MKIASKHTPGPWTQDSLGGTTVWASGKRAVAQCTGFERSENVANARLIAAAPELLDALRELVAEHDERNAGRDPARDGHSPDTGGVVLARAALAKAEE